MSDKNGHFCSAALQKAFSVFSIASCGNNLICCLASGYSISSFYPFGQAVELKILKIINGFARF